MYQYLKKKETKMSNQTNIPAVNMTVDVKEAITNILNMSNEYYEYANKDGDYKKACIRMIASNRAILAILQSIK